MIIYSIKIKVNQHFTLISPSDPNRIAQPPTDVRTVICLDGLNPPNFGAVEEKLGSDRQSPPTPARGGILKTLQPEEEYKIHHLGRLPNDSILRPSTQEWSESAVRVNHDIAMEVTYRVMTPEEVLGGSPKLALHAKGKEKERVPDRKKLVVAKPIEIFSVSPRSKHDTEDESLTVMAPQCCCFVDSLTLPAYSYDDPAAGGDVVPVCLCGLNTGK